MVLNGILYLTTSELAARWDMSPGTIYNQRYAGKGLPSFPFNRKIWYSMKDIEKHEKEAIENKKIKNQEVKNAKGKKTNRINSK